MSGATPLPSGKIVPRETASLWRENMLARAQAEEILAQARSEAEALLRNARIEAHEQVEEEIASRVAEQMSHITADYNYAVAQIEADLVHLTRQCLLQISTELPAEEFLQGVFQQAINELGRHEDTLQVTVSPWRLFEAEAALNQCHFDEDVKIKCVADESLDQDTILVSNQFGVVDVSPVKQIEALYSALREGLEE